MTVAPVVVMPLIDSKKASVKTRSDEEKIKGKDEKRAIIIHDNTVKTKACLKLILFFFPLNEKYKTNPMKKVKILENKKICQSLF